MENEVKTQMIARFDIIKMQNSYDVQIKEHMGLFKPYIWRSNDWVKRKKKRNWNSPLRVFFMGSDEEEDKGSKEGEKKSESE